MIIGKELKLRMAALSMDTKELSRKSFVDEDIIEGLLSNQISIDKIDILDFELISKCLFCDTEYLIDENSRKKDLIYLSIIKGDDTKSNIVKGQLQVVANDFIFLRNLISETNL